MMRVRRCPCVCVFRPACAVLVGFSLGFSLSLLSVSWVQEQCDPGAGLEERELGSLYTAPDATVEDIQPRVLSYQPKQGLKPKKIYRPKYISTELGIHERLFVGILSSKSSLNSMAVAVNRTIGHHLDSVAYFTGTRERKVPNGMFVVAHGDERHIWNMYQTVRFIANHFIFEYDFFYLAQDDTYTQGDRLKNLVGHISMNRMLYMGRPVEFVGGEIQGWYCHGGFGYLLSRPLLLSLKPFLENCMNDIVSARPDEWLGRCIVQYTHTQCVDQLEELQYFHFELGKNSDPTKEESVQFRNALTVHPVSSPEQMYRLHKHFSQIELQEAYQEIQKLQAEIKNVSLVAVDGNRTVTWPIGVNPPFQPNTRFEVLPWEYFTEDHIYSCDDGSARCKLQGIDKLDVADVIEVAMDELNRKYKPLIHLKKQRLLNGYRRFDPTRGMEYTLDLQLEAVNQKGRSCTITKRVHLLRPLSRLEIIPMPYVTEATKVHIILPVTYQDQEYVCQFLEVYANNALLRRENSMLTFLFLYKSFESWQVKPEDAFDAIRSHIIAYEHKYPEIKFPWIIIQTQSPSQLKFMDVVSKKHPVDTLFFVASPKTDFKSDFLNRCRMNSISNWQVFFPIHFQNYNPDIAYHHRTIPETIDLVKDSGMFDSNTFDEACFYNLDYMAARTRMASDVQENEELLESLDLYDMFVRYSGLHIFRAVEPSLHRHYSSRQCDPRQSEENFHRCMLSMMTSLGPRLQLALLLFEGEQGNST